MRKGAKKKGGSKAGRKAASTSSAGKNDDAIVETQSNQEVEEAPKVESPPLKEAGNEEEANKNQDKEEEQANPDSSTEQEKDPNASQNDEAPKVESPLAEEAGNEEEANENQEKEEELAKPDSSTQQEKDPNASQNDEAKGASSSQNEKPLRRGKRKRSTKNETEKKGETNPPPRAKRARATKPQEPEPEYFKEKRSLEDLWKAAFPVGTEWAQLDKLYESKWDFTNLEKALEESGNLYGKKVYVFGSTESHLVPYKNENKTVLVPAVICIESSIPPSDKIGITSGESEVEKIIPMKDMKMAWVPYVPLEKRDREVDRMNFQIFILGCTQRRSALKHLKEDRVKNFKRCLPYIYNPFKEDESEQSTVVQITFPSEPPVELEYDWEKKNLEDFTNDLIVDEALPLDKKDEFTEFVKEQCDNAKKTNEEAKQAREKAMEGMSEETKEAYKEMKLYKFYPLSTPDTPDLSGIEKSSFINKYFGKAHEVA
ncbi:hypothetical protein EUTSA_v10004094mg [Eutrema salsugineum]|uniref:Uncharacterized protein n=1 Tax=Eutrema salsugineum TaxID=72664 RepID=V4KVI6_EUTSA|nr:protein HEAT INTOLERANT 4 [Eutrema salsugineum]ESQ31383.1 hypothetical protein EUTSA_v10004094mg [Eutrema salsugineum]